MPGRCQHYARSTSSSTTRAKPARFAAVVANIICVITVHLAVYARATSAQREAVLQQREARRDTTHQRFRCHENGSRRATIHGPTRARCRQSCARRERYTRTMVPRPMRAKITARPPTLQAEGVAVRQMAGCAEAHGRERGAKAEKAQKEATLMQKARRIAR